MNIDEMPAGRKLDIVIQAMIFGDKVWHRRSVAKWADRVYKGRTGKSLLPGTHYTSGDYFIAPMDGRGSIFASRVPAYSTHDNPAFKLVDHMIALGHIFSLRYADGLWCAWFARPESFTNNLYTALPLPVGRGPTRHLAICRAALKARQVGKEQS